MIVMERYNGGSHLFLDPLLRHNDAPSNALFVFIYHLVLFMVIVVWLC